MSRELTRPETLWLVRIALAAGLALVSQPGSAEPYDEGPFSGMSGHWSGGGTITMTDGAREQIRCRATYSVPPGGRALSQSLRCASASYRLEISSNIVSSGGLVSGTWSEATYNVSGNVSGRASGPEIRANVTGGGFAASIGVRTRGNSQSVTIRPNAGAEVAAVNITLRRA